jgi:hypothetical protein
MSLATRFEHLVFSTATTRDAYFQRIANKMLELKNKEIKITASQPRVPSVGGAPGGMMSNMSPMVGAGTGSMMQCPTKTAVPRQLAQREQERDYQEKVQRMQMYIQPVSAILQQLETLLKEREDKSKQVCSLLTPSRSRVPVLRAVSPHAILMTGQSQGLQREAGLHPHVASQAARVTATRPAAGRPSG